MANILITSEYFGRFDSKAKQLLIEAGHKVIDNPYGEKFLTPEEIIKYAHDANAFICDLERITREVMDAAPDLKIISRRGVGVDSIDCEYAKQKNILVARALGVVEAPVAELVMGYILHFSRKIDIMNKDMHKGVWNKVLANNVNGKVIGVVGMGNIGYEVARRASAFGMRIIYHDLHRNLAAEEDFDTEKVSLSELLENADFISLHIPLNNHTKGLFDYQKLSMMKKDAYLINTARGAIVDENGLEKVLKEKKIAGAAIDVFDIEPKTSSVLTKFDNVILTPHVATFTKEVFIKMDILAAQNIINYFNEQI